MERKRIIKKAVMAVRKAPAGAHAPLQKGSRVHERGTKKMGTIDEHGPEVSGVRFDDGTSPRYINNSHLVNKGLPHGTNL